MLHAIKHRVMKIVLHSNLPGEAQFGRYAKCRWTVKKVGDDDGEGVDESAKVCIVMTLHTNHLHAPDKYDNTNSTPQISTISDYLSSSISSSPPLTHHRQQPTLPIPIPSVPSSLSTTPAARTMTPSPSSASGSSSSPSRGGGAGDKFAPTLEPPRQGRKLGKAGAKRKETSTSEEGESQAPSMGPNLQGDRGSGGSGGGGGSRGPTMILDRAADLEGGMMVGRKTGTVIHQNLCFLLVCAIDLSWRGLIIDHCEQS